MDSGAPLVYSAFGIGGGVRCKPRIDYSGERDSGARLIYSVFCVWGRPMPRTDCT